ncbi:NXPE family member 2-like [Polypterus senegalus]|uniref:NXPE family member 2-like n=1 Tax=Polypterus senegalus TaxID=55291 RepID=UPI001963093D|nr:NXPE family member 2-like [Polypterus senegalus]
MQVRVDMRDHKGNLKAHGGDFILSRIVSPTLKAAASGVVKDLKNGTYLVDFTLFWPGQVEVVLQLIHSREAVAVLWRVKQLHFDKCLFTGTFTNNSVTEKTKCFSYPNYSLPLCTYTDKRDNDTYFCLKPKTLPCETLTLFQSINNENPNMTNNETKLFDRSSIGVRIPNDFKPVTVVALNGELLLSNKTCSFGAPQSVPSGFFYKNNWYSSFCKLRSFSNIHDINSCLQGKTLHLRGDSTLRQWVEYLTSKLTDLKLLVHLNYFMPMHAFDVYRNISVDWKRHGHPWITFSLIPIKGGHFVAREVDRIAGGPNTIVGITVGQHTRPYPLQLHIQKLLNIRNAIKRLLLRSPTTTVFVKLENIRELSNSFRFSNWYGYIQNLAQREVFEGLNVTILDAWDMTVADNTQYVHPVERVIYSQIAIFLPYLCPNSSN